MQLVYVLGDERCQESGALKRCQRVVAGVGFRHEHPLRQWANPFVECFRLAPKAGQRGHLHRVGMFPQAGAAAAEIGNARGGRHARAGESHRVAGLSKQPHSRGNELLLGRLHRKPFQASLAHASVGDNSYTVAGLRAVSPPLAAGNVRATAGSPEGPGAIIAACWW